MTDFKQNYVERLKKYLYITPTIEVNGQTYLKVDMLKNSILDCEINASNLNNENAKGIVQYSNCLASLLPIYNEGEHYQTILEIDNLVRSPKHLRSLPAFSRQEVDFAHLTHDLKFAQNDKAKLKKIARTLSRDDFIVKILKFNYNINAIISSCIYFGNDQSVNQDKIDARFLANTRAEEMIKTVLTTNDMVFKFIAQSSEFVLDGTSCDIDGYLNAVCENLEKQFQNIQPQNAQQIHASLDDLRLKVAKTYTDCFATLKSVDQKVTELTSIKE